MFNGKIQAALISITFLLCTLPLFSEDKRTYEQIAASPETVADYFLLCPEIRMSEDRLVASDKNIIPDQSMVYYSRKSLLVKGKDEYGNTINPKIVDIPNGYIELNVANEAFSYRLTFVIFKRADKSVVPAYSITEEGPEGDSRSCVFFSLSRGDWARYSSGDIFPEIALSEFAPAGTRTQPGFEKLVSWEYTLPRNGTTVLLTPKPVDEHTFYQMTEGTPRDLGDYLKYMQSLSSRSLQLKWDASLGKFSRGRIVVGSSR